MENDKVRKERERFLRNQKRWEMPKQKLHSKTMEEIDKGVQEEL